jgi:hypothetical protein
VGTIDLHMEGSGAAEGASEDDLSAPPPPEGAQSWENLSPKEMRFLAAGPGSPAARRRSSSSAGSGPLSRSNSDSAPLRPVLSFGPELLEDEVIQDDDEGEQVAEEPPVKPQAGGIDEVRRVSFCMLRPLTLRHHSRSSTFGRSKGWRAMHTCLLSCAVCCCVRRDKGIMIFVQHP